ncbi:hypothetical protein [Streptomyces sp. NPDC051577]|uniref:hypothetical protein n=1 Tax=Streptomyces sp. NPDC051577 TaxID=3155166 RepID=UPI00343371D5
MAPGDNTTGREIDKVEGCELPASIKLTGGYVDIRINFDQRDKRTHNATPDHSRENQIQIPTDWGAIFGTVDGRNGECKVLWGSRNLDGDFNFEVHRIAKGYFVVTSRAFKSFPTVTAQLVFPDEERQGGLNSVQIDKITQREFRLSARDPQGLPDDQAFSFTALG